MTTVLLLCLACVLAGESPHPTTVPASNADEPGVTPGKRPYELDWANRHKPNHPQLVDFEDLIGWRVRGFDGAEAKLYRSKEQMLFGEYTAKAVYRGGTARSRFVMEPSEPIVIPNEFTGVNLWVRGNNWGWINPPRTARTSVRVLVRDAKDEEYRIPLGVNNFDYWFLMHCTLVSPDGRERNYERTSSKFDEVIDTPARFIGIEVAGCSNERPAKLFFDALSFYEIAYKPLTFEPQPETLAWPTTPDTILPTCKNEVRNEVQVEGKRYTFTARSGGETIRYVYAPATGDLSDLIVHAGGQRFVPCAKGGLVFELEGKEVRPGDPGVHRKLLNHKQERERIVADWEIRLGEHAARYRYAFRVKGKSLVVDVSADGGKATRFDIGLARGLHEPKAVYIPFLTCGNEWPKVVCSMKDDKPVFLLALLDYYNSEASALFGTPRLQDKHAVGYNGGAVYRRKTDGERNDLRERVFINVSRDVHEVLPNIPNPKCDTGEIAREFTWRNIAAPQREMLARYKAYGIDKFIACHHEIGWRDAGESFTMRLRAAPRIGDEKLAEYSEWLRGLGYRFGTYTNYVDFAPVNANWDEDAVCLNPDGTWQTAWPRCYALKPLRAVEKEAYYAPRIHEKFGTNAQYCDVHTCYVPWGRTDYDARTPGAGKFKTQFNAFARLLLNESKAHHGPVFSEGSYHWFYAGIVDGNYGQIVPHGRGWQIEPIVDFDLLKMHPLMTDFGMGMPSMYYGRHGAWTEDRSHHSRWFDQFHTSTIAFGHIGYLASEWGFAGTLKSYYLIQALQKRYTMVPVEQIRYFDGERLVDTSTALITDAYKRRQIYARYASGLETWCNLSPEHYWSVRVDERDYVIPPFGFVAHRKDDILAYSAIVDGRRHELVVCDEVLYLDSRGQVVRTPWITTKGAVAVKRGGKVTFRLPANPRGGRVGSHEGQRCWIIPATTCEEVTLSARWLTGDEKASEPHASPPANASAHDKEGNRIGPATIRQGVEDITVMPTKGAIRYSLDVSGPQHVTYWFDVKPPMCQQIVGTSERVEVVAGTHMHSGLFRGHQAHADRVPDDGTPVRMRQARKEAGYHLVGFYDLALPTDAIPNARHWYRFRLTGPKGSTLCERWLDVTAVPAFALAIEPIARPHTPGRAMPLRLQVKSHLPSKLDAKVSLDMPAAWQAVPKAQTSVLAPQETKTLRWTIRLPRAPVVDPITIRAEGGGLNSGVRRFLKTYPTAWTAADLTKLELTTGECIRGRAEGPTNPSETGALVHASRERVGEVRMPAIFMHPPYRTGAGYSFAAASVTLPEGKPKLEFALGFREGSTSADGCLFKVVVIDGDESKEVFAEQYATLDAWAHREVDLSAFAGKQATIKLITDAGPANNTTSDWACWGRPRVTLGDDVFAVEVHETEPTPAFLPAPRPLQGLRAADLERIASAKVTLETAGVNGGEHASYVYLNGVKIGQTPTSGSDTVWGRGEIVVSQKALGTIGRSNELVIKNPGDDFMKVRKFCLHFTLDDGRQGSSWVDVGPYTSAKGWPHEEGKAVPIGADLPTVRLIIPVE